MAELACSQPTATGPVSQLVCRPSGARFGSTLAFPGLPPRANGYRRSAAGVPCWPIFLAHAGSCGGFSAAISRIKPASGLWDTAGDGTGARRTRCPSIHQHPRKARPAAEGRRQCAQQAEAGNMVSDCKERQGWRVRRNGISGRRGERRDKLPAKLEASEETNGFGVTRTAVRRVTFDN